MNALLIKRLFRVIHSGSPSEIDTVCRRIVEEEKKQGHGKVAKQLEQILVERVSDPQTQFKGNLRQLPQAAETPLHWFRKFPWTNSSITWSCPMPSRSGFLRIEREFATENPIGQTRFKAAASRILLYGPPGCGKSLGAERLAWNTGLPLRKVRFDTLLSSYFGETMANLRKVFDAAQASPCTLFLDECDSLARSRSERNDVGEINRITNGLLEMLEDYRGDGLVIAATNLDSSLDTALFRRFDEILRVPVPGIDEINRLLQTTLSSMNKQTGMSWKELAQAMDGMSGSEVVHVAENAAKHAVLEGHREVSGSDIRFALAEAQERMHSH